MQVKSLTDEQFVQVLTAALPTANPEFQLFLDRLEAEGRLFIDKLSPAEKSHLYYRFKYRIHVKKYHNGLLVYLEPKPKTTTER